MKSRLPTEPALIGRDQETKLLMRYLESALDGKGTTVFIYGEAGIGKTRLVNEFLDFADKTGAKILGGGCLSGAAVPYFPFTEAFNSYISTIGDAKMKTALTKHLGITGWLRGPKIAKESDAAEIFSNPAIERDRTFEATATALLRLSAHEPTILFLDDLQWADHLSLALIHYVARRCRNSRLLIIGTYRPEELIPTKEGKLHLLEEAMFSMSREDLLTKMELSRLNRDDFPELLRSIFQSQFDEEFAEKLYRETGGNPLFVLETLKLLAEEGLLSERRGQWMLEAPAEKVGIPSKVHEVIIRRISRLEREERKLLDIAAVCGNSFSPDTLRRTLGLDIAEVFEKLVAIEQRHRLIRAADSAFEFTHHKIREVIYESLHSDLRRIYHLKTASCLEQVLAEKVSDGYLADVALHYVEGGALERAFEYLVKLGEKAVKNFAYAQAMDYLNKALEATQKASNLATDENLTKIYKFRGMAWLLQDQWEKAKDDLNLMLQNAANINDKEMIAEAHYLLGEAYQPYGEVGLDYVASGREALRHLTTAVEIARETGNKPLEVRSLGLIGVTLLWVETPDTLDEARTRLEEASEMSKEIGDKIQEASHRTGLGMYYNWRGEFSLAKENLNRAIALNEEVGTVPLMIFKLFCLCMVLAGNGEYNEAISTGQRSLKLAQDFGFWAYASMALNTLAWIYHDLSNINLAIKYNNEAIENARIHQRGQASGAVPSALLNLGMNHLYMNDYENSEKHFKEVENVFEQHRLGWWRIKTRLLLCRGEIALAKGDYQQALKLAENSLAISEKAISKKYIAKGWKLKAEILAKIGNLKEANELMEDALKLAQQVGNPPTLWQTHYSLGLLHEKRGDPQKANEHHAEAIALIETTAAGLNAPSLKNSLLSSAQTKEIHDANKRTKPA
ncbi:MAG: tetratricopeptide repeat protein [Candidatus Bathyarchaeota archaeon]|nr:MAG: tetratricopeptide repeat protein [Candidatus Bathyarchaeota archaeon]